MTASPKLELIRNIFSGLDLNDIVPPIGPGIDVKDIFLRHLSDGRLVSEREQVSADVTVPPYAWLVPGAMPGLAIALDMAEDKAEASGYQVIAALLQLLDFYTTPARACGDTRFGSGQENTGAARLR